MGWTDAHATTLSFLAHVISSVLYTLDLQNSFFRGPQDPESTWTLHSFLHRCAPGYSSNPVILACENFVFLV